MWLELDLSVRLGGPDSVEACKRYTHETDHHTSWQHGIQTSSTCITLSFVWYHGKISPRKNGVYCMKDFSISLIICFIFTATLKENKEDVNASRVISKTTDRGPSRKATNRRNRLWANQPMNKPSKELPRSISSPVPTNHLRFHHSPWRQNPCR